MALPRVPRSRPRPKLRAIPRRKTEAAVIAEIQQLTVEKQRLQQQLVALIERRQQIETRLLEIDQEIQSLQSLAANYAEVATDTVTQAKSGSPSLPINPSASPGHTSFVIDY